MEPVYLFLRGKNRRQGIEQFTYVLPGTAKRYIVTYVYEPHKGSKKENKDMVHEIIGDGQCLGITKDDVNNNIEGNNYDLVARVSNEAGTDSAICTVQYYNWCLDPGYTKPQVWINDLCRLSTVREDPTPVGILLSLIEEKIVNLGRGIDSTWMLIEKKKTDKHDPERLIKIYSEKYGYSLVGEGVGIPPFLFNDRKYEFCVLCYAKASGARNKHGRSSWRCRFLNDHGNVDYRYPARWSPTRSPVTKIRTPTTAKRIS